jgi:hypothetical protein
VTELMIHRRLATLHNAPIQTRHSLHHTKTTTTDAASQDTFSAPQPCRVLALQFTSAVRTTRSMYDIPGGFRLDTITPMVSHAAHALDVATGSLVWSFTTGQTHCTHALPYHVQTYLP